MYKYGLKLWSTNTNYIKEAVRLHREGVYDYIELFTVPGSAAEYIDVWKGLNIPFVIHAAHFRAGMNLAKKENEVTNRVLIRESQLFADQLSADRIIVHPGIAGKIEETARQLKMVNDPRILIENNPYQALDDGLICNGATPEEIGHVMKVAGIGFCLDIGHAICTANAVKEDQTGYLKSFLSLKPQMFHLTDGDRKGILDSHRHIHQGDYAFAILLALLPNEAMITVETDKDSDAQLEDFKQDILRIKEYERN